MDIHNYASIFMMYDYIMYVCRYYNLSYTF